MGLHGGYIGFALKGLVIRVLGLGDIGLLVRDMGFRGFRLWSLGFWGWGSRELRSSTEFRTHRKAAVSFNASQHNNHAQHTENARAYSPEGGFL